jgi:nucleoid-associated protein YgaU
VLSYKVPATIPRDGVPYKIRWGDTLWDISAAFYRNPWLYPRIARFNNIRNPNLIISGTTIRIPPKN